eukprot:jgi/Orpsp1_1/1187950/evm.model.d7180000061398.1
MNFQLFFNEIVEYQDKIRIILNKVDSINSQNLVKVYGGLMWSLSNIFKTPEVHKVYLGSFRKHDEKYKDFKNILKYEENELLNEMKKSPKKFCNS